MKHSLNCTVATLVLVLAFGRMTAADAQVVVPVDFAPASLGDARLGVAIATIAELGDAPDLLARPSAQTYVDAAFARIAATTVDADVRRESARTRADLQISGAGGFDRARTDADLAALTRGVLKALPAPRDRLCVVGILAEQTAYNARVLRSPSTDATLRKSLGAANVADTLVPGLGPERAQLAALASGRWSEIAQGAETIVAGLLGGAALTPFAPSDGVWLVLLRSRPVAGEAVRHGTPHVWLDVVRFDGTHRSIGAYPPDGDFSRDAPSLACAEGRESDLGSERATPVAPPPGTTPAQLADALSARCAARPAAASTYRVGGASDTRYVVDVLVAVGVDANATLRASTAPR